MTIQVASQPAPILSVRDLRVHFPILRRTGLISHETIYLTAVDNLSFDLAAGQTLGVVGESGCGKSTMGRAILRLIEPSGGQVLWLGRDLSKAGSDLLRTIRRDMQIVFQDPLAALDPRMTVGQIVAEPLENFEPGLSRAECNARVADMLARVGLLPEHINRYPHEFSGGQCQRIGIARAMILKPKLIICDEPVSALDVSVQGQILNLLRDLQAEFGLSLIFISHNLAVVFRLCHRVIVLYLGRMVEEGLAEDVVSNPAHPYTRALIAAVPNPDPAFERGRVHATVRGEPPSPLDPPSGCVFRTRCAHAMARCEQEVPLPRLIGDRGHRIACHLDEPSPA